MKSDLSSEQLFIAEVDSFDLAALDLEQVLLAMHNWRARCESALEATTLCWPGLTADHPLALRAAKLNQAVAADIVGWAQEWRRLAPTQALAKSLDGQVVLLVFGKFNAGKSSFCNMLADRFATSGKTVEYFHLDAGRIVDTPESFEEGVTETTSRVQGVRLGGKLVLVDTPGLHSVTPDNAALTQLFTDSADAVLWLTSSTSPGQVQELDELARELRRNKPLLPVLTRSDVFEEDEVDGEIAKVLRAKTPANRALQEGDVSARAEQKLTTMGIAASLLRPPVSISSLLARQRGQSAATLAEAGVEQLYAALLAIVQPTLAYQRRKQAEIMLHYLEETVLGLLRSDVMPQIGRLRSSATALLEGLPQRREELAGALWRVVVPQLPALMDDYAVRRDVKALSASLSAAVRGAYTAEARAHWQAYQLLEPSACADSGLGIDTLAQGAAEDGADFDYQGWYGALTMAVRSQAMTLADSTVAQVRASVGNLDRLAERLEAGINIYGTELLALKNTLRAQFS
jgi:GTPase SAR1 family protein